MPVSDKVRVGVVGLGYWGPNLARNFDRARRTPSSPGAATLDEATLERKARSLYPNAVVTDDLDDAAGRRRARRDRRRHPGAHPLRPRASARSRPASTASSRSRIALRAADAEDLVGDRRGHGRQADGRPPARVPPGGGQAEGARRRRRARRVHYVYANRLNLGKLRTDENALWSLGAARRLGHQLPDRRGARGGLGARRVLPAATASRTSSSATSASPAAWSATCTCRWLDPHKERRSPSSARDEDGRLRRHGVRAQGDGLRQGLRPRRGPSSRPTASSSPCTSATSTSRRSRNDEPLRIECQHFVDCIREDRQPRSDGRDALNVVRVLEAMERSLREGGRPVKTTEL